MTPRFGRVLLFSTALCIYVIDRAFKLFALKILSVGQSIKVIPGLFHLTLVFNKGAAFGLLKDRAAFFILMSSFVITFIILFAWRHKGMPASLTIPLGLILGGAIGNLVDRATFGYVIDFLDFRVWPVFNIADSAISVGVGILVITTALKRT